MKLSIALSTLLVSTFVGSSSPASGGGMEGGGGVGVRCGSKLELLDLHEARLRGLKLVSTPDGFQSAIQTTSQKMGEHFYWYTWSEPQNAVDFYEEMVVRPMFQGRPVVNTIKCDEIQNCEFQTAPVNYVSNLPLSTDIGSYNIAPGCSLEQVAYYYNDNNPRLEVVRSRWNELDLLSKSALVAHESIYYFDRDQNLRKLLENTKGQTSEWARRFVGELFSTQPPAKLMQGVPLDWKKRWVCGADLSETQIKQTRLILREDANGFTAFVEELYNTQDLYQITAKFLGANIGDFVTAISGEGQVFTDLNFTNNLVPTQLKIGLSKKQNEPLKISLFTTRNGKTVQVQDTQELSCWIEEQE
jgi:hypothetical protein